MSDLSVPISGGRTVRLRPLPLGFHRLLLQRGLVPPEPPLKVCRDSRGQAVRDDRGLAVMRHAAADPNHLVAKARYDERIAAVMVKASLSDKAALGAEPLETEPAEGDWIAYADRLLESLARAGVTAGDFVALCRGVSHASGLIDAAYETASDSLFPTAAAAGQPTTSSGPAASTTSPSGRANG